ncbi:hypothetical protein [Peribacillus loiseleuriae]|uniref:Uncharacterized protein n=1 Tax=Peribacillus loiseleuriae TaxID=1679170 RepID=A0A0K9GSP0_9BACI|nr:hypothetical protein [Peribacillus loiseleuriae]KMY49631.1 hypothetical protein AC625_08840 [Peribacillus loiseleuriae]
MSNLTKLNIILKKPLFANLTKKQSNNRENYNVKLNYSINHVTIHTYIRTAYIRHRDVYNNFGNSYEYSGQSTITDSGVCFTSDEIQSVGETIKGNTVKATFDEDGDLMQVVKINKETN